MNHPFTCMIVGPTKAGKTVFVRNLIENKDKMMLQEIHNVYWFYSEDQPLYHDLKNCVHFEKHLPDVEQLKLTNGNKLVILDDFIQKKITLLCCAYLQKDVIIGM